MSGRRIFTEDFTARAVDLVVTSGRSLGGHFLGFGDCGKDPG